MRSLLRIAPVLAALLAAAACDNPSDSGRRVADVEAISGDAQQGAAGAQLAAPLVARVTNSNDRPVSGRTVLFNVISGGGSLSASQGVTGTEGTAETRWTLGTVAGQEQRVEARVVDPGGTILAADTFTATAIPGAPTRVVKVAGDGQSAAPGAALADSLAVRVEDANGNPVTGAAVTWTVTAGGGSVSPATSTSGAGGIARTQWRVGPAGAQAATASVAGGTPVTFTATSVVGAPARVVKVSGDGQSGPPGTTLADSLAVRVEDANGNAVPGATVVWGVSSGGGSVRPFTSVSGPDGIARTQWTLGGAGVQTAAAAAQNGPSVTFTATLTPAPDVTYGAAFVAGPQQTCAITTEGRLYCWGRSYLRQWDVPTPINFSGTLTQVTAGIRHVCALTTAGAAYCVGTGLEGQLGNNSTSGNGLVAVQGGLTFTRLAAGENHTCGLTAGGAAYCWGYNNQGQLGNGAAITCNGDTPCSSVPVAVAGGHTFTQLDAEVNTTCGITAGTGRVLCWGFGYGNAPVAVGTERVYTQVAVGFDHLCALSGTQAYCRGVNTYGQLGTGEVFQQNAFTPVVGGHAFSQVVAGWYYTCGLTTGGTALCWGRNSEGTLGQPLTTDPRPTPTPVSGGLSFTRLSAGQAHACGRATDGRLYCWGNNSYNQLGDGTTVANRTQPTRVIRQQ